MAYRDSYAIAVVGMACRFPGEATCPSKFWDLLKNGRVAYSQDTDRYNTSAFYHANSKDRQNVLPTKGGHFITEDPYNFDTAFFKVSAIEASSLDPKQRMLLEVAYEAFENAGLPLQKVAGTQTACYMGTSPSDYRDAIVRDFENWPRLYLIGANDEMISNRLSHFYDLHGPSVTVETACSSSLVAIHQACQSLRSGEATMAIAGGVNLILTPEATMELHNLSVINPEGRSRSFDEDANGYGRGEGCGIIVLKPLDMALRDGDRVRAVIRASGVNSDGWTKSLSQPSGSAQANLIRSVYESRSLDFSSTQYVEAHGTGTKVGDPIEIAALHNTIGQGTTKDRKLYVGSVKANIGHLEPASGVAGVIKGILALEHGYIPPNVNFDKANPDIPFDEWNIVVPTKLTPWPEAQTKRVSVSSFGVGGTNAHVVLEEYHAPSTGLVNGIGTSYSCLGRLFVLSSQDQAGIKRVCESLIQHIDGLSLNTPVHYNSELEYLASLAHTLSVTRSGLEWKASCTANSISQLRQNLSADPGESMKMTRASNSDTEPRRVAFVFTGQGAQWAGMGIELLERPVFGDSIAKSARILHELGCDWDPVTELRRTDSNSRLGLPEISQPICTVLQIALVDELKSWGPGIQPVKVVGHSSGEIAAAYCIGALTHRDAIAVAYFRGQASAMLPTVARHLNGGMMAVGCSSEKAQTLISELRLHEQVTVACVNSPSSITLSGDSAAIEEVAVALEREQIFCRKLRVKVAYHSSHVATVSGEYYESIAEIEPAQGPDGPSGMISSVSGEEVSSAMLGPVYWLENFLSPVLFSDAVKEMVLPAGPGLDSDSTKPSQRVDVLVEIGPHSTLGGPIEQTLSHYRIYNIAYQSMLQRGSSSLESTLKLAQELFHQGVSLDMCMVNGDVGVNCQLLTDLPPYPWLHERKYDAYPRLHRELVQRKAPRKSLLGAQVPTMQDRQHVWRGFVRLDEEPWLRGHMVGDTVVFPAAGMISMVLEAAQQLIGSGQRIHALRLRDVSVFAVMSIQEGQGTEVILTMRPYQSSTAGQSPGQTHSAWWEFTVSSASNRNSQLRDNSHGLIAIDFEEGRSEHMVNEDASIISERLSEYHDAMKELQLEAHMTTKDAFYRDFERGPGFRYSEIFRGLENLHTGPGRTCFDLRITDLGDTFSKGQQPNHRPFLVHPATLDSILQSWVAATYRNGVTWCDKPFAPTSMGEMELMMDIPGNPDDVMTGFSISERLGFNEHKNDIFLFNKSLSKIYMSIVDLRVSELDVAAAGVADEAHGAKAKFEDGEGPTVTSQIKWDYALGQLQGTEMAELVCAATASGAGAGLPEDRLAELIRMVLHEKPSATVIELVQDRRALHRAVVNATWSKPGLLPRGALPSSHVRYAVVQTNVDVDVDDENAHHENGVEAAVHGAPFSLQVGSKDAPFPAESDNLSADLLVVPPWSLENFGDVDRDRVLNRFISLAKPGCILLLAANSRPQHAAVVSFLRSHGLQLLAEIPGKMDESTAVYKSPETQSEQESDTITSAQEFVILEPSTSLTGPKEFSRMLKDTLIQQGQLVSVKNWSVIADASSRIEPFADTFGANSVISLLELQQPMLHDLSEPDFETLRSIIRESDRFIWVTCGDDPLLYTVDGFARTIANENTGFRFQILHLSSTGLVHGPSLAARVMRNTKDNEFREVDGLLQTARLYKSYEGDRRLAYHYEDSTRIVPLTQEKSPHRLAIGRPGLLDTLHFVKDERLLQPLADTDVEIQVRASGINFKDIMAAMGLVPMPMLGVEASGIVVKTGKAATHFKPGDHVVAQMYGSHATTIRAHHAVVAKIPEGLTFEEAAGLSLVHTTAYYALVKLAKLRKGQSVLIHSAAGGLGQAAVQLATHLGLVIYITVGSETKRAFMMERFKIPEAHIFYSRDLSFVKGIARITNGRGVDCILNSLADELLRGSWDSGCLAPFGTFVELGLRDITNNAQLDMRPFKKNATFTFCDLFNNDVEDIGEAMGEVLELVSQGHLSVASPLQAYRVGQVEEVFRLMQQGKHLGKAVLSFTGDTRAPVLHRAKDSFQLVPTATYLLVGGMGGLGRSLARNFAATGARNIAFISRSGDTTAEAKALIAELGSQGVTVRAYRSDISSAASFLDAMEQCSRDLPPVKGVVQLAMVLRDSVFEKMSYAQWTEPLRPKVQGSRNLHEYFDDSESRSLDFFIMCSSVSGVCGNPSQASYAAGNTYQDALAHYRRARGLKTVAIDLGVMRDVGVIAEKNTEVGLLEQWEKVTGIPEPIFHALIQSIIIGLQEGQSGSSDEPPVPAQVVTGLGDADTWAANGLPVPYYLNDPRFGPLAITSTRAGSEGPGDDVAAAGSFASQLARASTMKQAANIVTDALVKRTAEIVQMPAAEVDPSQTLGHYGIDSLTAIEVRNWITREFQANLALLEIVSAVPIKEFAIKIVEKSKIVLTFATGSTVPS